MKEKKLLFSLLLMLCLIAALPTAASAAKAQWKTENGVRYYYGTNGKKYTGGPKKINGKLYLFTSKGELITNQVTSYKNKLYVSDKTGALLTKWGKVNGISYYGTSKGYLKTGLVTYNKNYYYFDTKNGKMLKNVWKKVGKYHYYFTGSGKAVKNKTAVIKGDTYYFNSKAQRVSGVVKLNGNYYGFGIKYGKRLYGWYKLNGFHYYFDPKTGKAAIGWKTISGKKYYFNSYGARQTGWLVLGSKKYYLDPNNNGARVTGTKKISGKTFNFGSKGYVTYKPSGNIRIEVNRKKNVVTIYDNNIPIKAMLCSTGIPGCSTPTGTFTITSHHSWWWLNGPSVGQYCSHFLPSYLFHSVPMYGSSWGNPYRVSASDYNRLGKAASGGCIRLAVADAKWIYYNCPIGTVVKISDNAATPLGKPTLKKMTAGTVGADPTDDFTNPGGYSVKITK